MTLYRYKDKSPAVASDAMIFENAVVIGDVHIARGASIWPGATIRADNDTIIIGENSNVQEQAVLHVDPGHPLDIGTNVTVGHQAVVHGCTIGDGTLIGIGAVVLNGAKIGKNCLVGAGALVPEGREIPDGSLVIGIGKVVRELSADEIANLHAGTAAYAAKSRTFLLDLDRIE
ncbi:gamma carbonic anhydrase family protein [Bordetella genomosp. 8]|uniref:Gamma carbonic anhydrase family protein n=1 Tax=Bordetella genomosp. 8 TaxID=1416806 RepID=A0A1W6YU92_9BORD|nr:gamma carbonic anhydrase family protein [Bordetella genomosp. 8]ARP84655.1 gamma carbonic anhydrase family protein [Bordetella genomosp. 8]